MSRKICMINLYFGKQPKWLNFFFKGCQANQDIDFVIFSDISFPEFFYPNVRIIDFTLPEFNELASKKLGFKVSTEIPYKICDFKPIFGKIFEDYLSGYSFWGYCDNDLILGDIKCFIDEKILVGHDIISTYGGFLSGPFSIYKNNGYINNLYNEIVDLENKLNYKYCLGIDENIQREELIGYSLIKLKFAIQYFYKLILHNLPKIKHIKEIRYQFQWNFKQHMLGSKSPIDMTEVVWQQKEKGVIKVYFNELLLSEYYLERLNKNDWELFWKEGKLFDNTKKEIFAFHFRASKVSEAFIIDEYKNQSCFRITKYGIFNKIP
jgi:hypothetical protein